MDNTEESLFQLALTEFIGEDKNEQSKLVYSYLGLAIFWAQCIEQTFENMLILEQVANKEGVTEDFIDTIYDKTDASKATMGRQINDVKKVYSISDEHVKELKSVLDKRNFLAHKFFKVYSFKFFSEQGKLEMIEECTHFVEKTQSLDAKLNDYYEEYKAKIGITEDLIQRLIKQAEEKEIERVKNKYDS